ncbi:phosphotransferase enzyme family protein [Chitinophagaceae bacterium LWZ2-11]
MSYDPTASIPAIVSTLSPMHIGYFLQEKYKLSVNTTCRLIKAGINHTYIATDGQDKYVFRLYSFDWRTRNEILEEIRLLNLVKENNIPVSYALKDVNDNYIQELSAPEGIRFGVMFSYAKGEKLLNFSVEQHYKIGEIMARFHTVTHNVQLERVTYTSKVMLEDSFEKLKQFLPLDTPEMNFMQQAQTYLLNAFENINMQEVRKGAVHMDIWFDNFNITEEGIILFDFDFCGNGLLCYDIAYYILQLHSTEKEEAVCKLKVDNFYKGYESIMQLTEEEKRLIPMLGVSFYFFYLGIQSERFDNWSNTFLNETYLKRFINLLVKKYYESNGLGS